MADVRTWVICAALLIIGGSGYLFVVDLQEGKDVLSEIRSIIGMVLLIVAMLISIRKGEKL